MSTKANWREIVQSFIPEATLKRSPSMFYVVDGKGEFLSGYKTTAEKAWVDAYRFLKDAGR